MKPPKPQPWQNYNIVGTETGRITRTTMQGLAPLSPSFKISITELAEWCSQYDKRTAKFPVDTTTRYLIGLYQIHQGVGWNDIGFGVLLKTANCELPRANKDESFVAAALHFIMVAERLNLCLEAAPMIHDLAFAPERALDHKRLVWTISYCAQQVFYGTKSAAQRRDRYNQRQLTDNLAWMIEHMFAQVGDEDERRHKAVTTATSIMAGLK